MHQMPPTAFFVVLGVYGLVIFAVYIGFAIGNGFLAGRLGRSVPVWVTLSLIPLVNLFFSIYVMYVVLIFIIDRLKHIPPAPST